MSGGRAGADEASTRLSFEPRPPYLGPRRRDLGAAELASLRRWVAAQLELEPSAQVHAVEWVAHDVRDTPHVTAITIASTRGQWAFAIGKSPRELGWEDLPAWLRGSARPLAARPAPSGR